MPKSAVCAVDDCSEALFEIPHGYGDDYAGWLVDRTVSQLIRRRRFRESDRDDLTQELMLKLLESWPQFDPQKAQASTFVATVIRNAISNLLRHQQLEKELLEFTPAVPDVAVEGHEQAIDREHDVAIVLDRLPPDLRRLAERLKTESVQEVARSDGVLVAEINEQVRQLRSIFRDAGVTLEL